MLQYPKDKLAQIILQYCTHYQIDHAVISPGSRNAPLTIGFVNLIDVRALQIVDERCAAFFALGIAQQSQRPVVLVCTSGSALLNYYPAVAEAFYSHTPLIIISADRPKHLIDIGDGQTIRQKDVFKKHSLFNANLDPTKGLTHNELKIQQAFQEAFQLKGPVHINIPFEEPLYETVNKYSVSINKTDFSPTIAPNILPKNLEKIWKGATKKMILVGAMYPNTQLQEVLESFTADESVIVLTETTANVNHPMFINAIDKVIFSLSDDEFKALQPDIVITVGGMIVSKRVKQFLRKYQPKAHWHIGENQARNTFFCLTHHVDNRPELILKEFPKSPDGDYQKTWLELKSYRNKRRDKFLETAPFSDLKVWQIISETLPNHIQLQLANSSIIRYHQLFDANLTHEVFCNRGTSGIDGSTSTAIGAALTHKKPTVFITGDISFFYDSNALWNKYIPKSFRVILINNSGGGIFRFIPGPKSTNALEFFETPHQLNAKSLCNMYNFGYYSADDESSLKDVLEHFYSLDEQPKLLEISTPSVLNDKVLLNYFNYLK